MNLEELLEGDETAVSEWLSNEGLLHLCNCGYTVYDPDAVNEIVQIRFGDERYDEIFDWACNLSNSFGWMDLESSQPKYGIYHCQHCAVSELSLMTDMATIAEYAEREHPKPKAKRKNTRKHRDKYVVYVDESYTNEFPRKAGGSLALTAFIVSQKDATKLEAGLAKIVAEAYRGRGPKEIRYNKLKKYPRLLEEVGGGISKLISSLPSSAIISVYAPAEGFIQEAVRVVHATSSYAKRTPTQAELSDASSPERIEEAVRKAVNGLAHILSGAVGNFLGSRGLSGEIWFDPRSTKLDADLNQQLAHLLPLTPINVPLIQHAGTIVAPMPGPNMEQLGSRVKVQFATASHKSVGLQIADFLAGDIRTFFADVPEILTDGTSDKPLVNSRILFPEIFRPTSLEEATKKKISECRGSSLLPHYRTKLVNDFVSCYTKNGQMRNVDIAEGVAYDIID